MYNSLGYKNQPSNMSYQTLRNMARTPIIRSIITTRQEQVASYAEPTSDDQKMGWTIKKKRGVFDKKSDKMTEADKGRAQDIIEFIMNTGNVENTWSNDNFDSFLRKIVKDTLEIDQMCFENVRNRRGQLVQFEAVDSGTFRLAESYDDREGSEFHEFGDKINGYYPSYVQVYNQTVYNAYYPWELCFGIRNISTSVYNNGYGISELEDMIQIITWMLYGMQYNGNFFKQGSNPKGLLHIKGNVPDQKMAELKQMWRSTISGISNAHKMPILDGNSEMQWIDMQQTNKDMEFSQWQDFLMVIACSVYRIDPSELGLNLEKAKSIFGQDGQKQRLEHSQAKGLNPLLKFIQRKMTKYIVSQLDPSFEFQFTGLEQEDKVVALDMDVKKVTMGAMSLEDVFKKYSGRDFNPDKDTILNPAYIQIKQMNMMGGDQSNQAVDEQNGEKPNPFMKGFNDYMNKELYQEKIEI